MTNHDIEKRTDELRRIIDNPDVVCMKKEALYRDFIQFVGDIFDGSRISTKAKLILASIPFVKEMKR